MNKAHITAKQVRYVKLGRSGGWEEECLQQGIVRLGFSTHKFIDYFPDGGWEEKITAYYQDRDRGTITNYLNQVRSFFQDNGETLWITFNKRQMWWAFLDPLQPIIKHQDGKGTYRKTLSGWKSNDITGFSLDMNALSGNLTKIAGFRGTSCQLKEEEKKYVLRRINGIPTPSAADAKKVCDELKGIVVQMMRLLTPKDFELLVDLVFTTSGWRRLSVVGGTEKTIDMELVLPTTGEKAFIQVKSKTSQHEFDEEYFDAFQKMMQFGRLFYIFHTSVETSIECAENNVTIIDAKRLAQMILDAGLVSWLIEKVS